MARLRMIKPEFWTDEKIGEASMPARLLFIGALNFADDHGGLERSSKQLKAQIFPYDSIDCEPLVLELIRLGLFIEYQVADGKYLHIKGFHKHQKVDHPSKFPKTPAYDGADANPRDDSSNTGDDSGKPKNAQGGLARPRESSLSSHSHSHIHTQVIKSTARKSAPSVEPTELLDFKIAYPKRAGDQGWRKAQRAAHARITEGHTWRQMIEGAKRYAAHVRSTGNEGSVYVKQACTFLGPDKHFLLPWDPAPTKADLRLVSNTSAADEFMRRTEPGS